MQKVVNVIDIGSRRISALVGGNGVNGSFNIRTLVRENYDGYINGEFISTPSLKWAISEAINKIEKTTKKPFNKAFIGIPAEFCVVRNADATLTFDKPKTINDKIINELCNMALGSLKKLESYTLINRSPIAFVCDDGRRTTETKGLRTRSITACLCFVFIKKTCERVVNQILKELGILEYDYVCSPLAQGIFLLNAETRKNEAVLIDVGYISTFVAMIKGEGICEIFAFSRGGGHIAGDLSECLKIKYNEAIDLKSKLMLSVAKNDKDIYNIESGAKTLPVMAKVAHEICEARIEDIASHINRALASFKVPLAPNKEVYLTGGGICSVRGGKDFLSKSLGRSVEIAKSPVLMLREPDNSSVLSVLNFALLISEIEKRK